MEDIFMFCNATFCECEDKCCQCCEKAPSCENKCSNMQYKEKIYSSDSFLVKQLFELADELDSWLIAVAAERLRCLVGLEKSNLERGGTDVK